MSTEGSPTHSAGSAVVATPVPALAEVGSPSPQSTLAFDLGGARGEVVRGSLRLFSAPTPASTPTPTDTLLIPVIPISLPQLAHFLSPFVSRIASVRIVQVAPPSSLDAAAPPPLHPGARTWAALLTFCSPADADAFVSGFNGKSFGSASAPDVPCTVLRVASVEIDGSGGSLSSSTPALTGGAPELPACPVCLERLDDTTLNTTGCVITTVCAHSLHAACLAELGLEGGPPPPCPVCRAVLAYGEGGRDASACATCGVETGNWACLLCGVVGCGRFAGEHALSHFRSTGECLGWGGARRSGRGWRPQLTPTPPPRPRLHHGARVWPNLVLLG